MKYSYQAGVIVPFARKHYKLLILAVAGLFLTSISAMSLMAGAVNSTVVVTGDTSSGENQPGWLFNRDTSTSTPYEFNSDQASIGSGSLYVEPIGATPADKFIGEFFMNTPIADVTGVDYDYMIGTGGAVSDANEFYMNVYANFGESDPFKFYDCRYNVVPSVGSTSAFNTVSFDTTLAYPVTTRSSSPYTCPATPAGMDALSPGSTIRVIALNVGDTSANDIGLDGYLDNVVVSTTSGSTTYDFEPATTPVSKDECKKGGWMTFNSPSFKNQGQCVSFVASQGRGNR